MQKKITYLKRLRLAPFVGMKAGPIMLIGTYEESIMRSSLSVTGYSCRVLSFRKRCGSELINVFNSWPNHEFLNTITISVNM